MPRRVRVEFAGAVYHVMARGNEQRVIFRDDKDRLRFLDALAEAVTRFGLRVYAYCLMANHYHLIVGTPRGNLSRTMAWLQTTYTARFNARHRRSGHLFEGRFKAQLIEADEYGRWLVEYLHLNPVRPRDRATTIAVERRIDLERYRWSSHAVYCGRVNAAPEWLCLDWMKYWGRTRREAQREYRKSIARAFGQKITDRWELLRGGLVLGGEDLYESVRELAQRRKGKEPAAWTRQEDGLEHQAHVRRLIADEPDDRIKLWARVRLGGERPGELAREHGYADASGVTYRLKRLEQQSVHNPKLAAQLRRLKNLSKVND